MTWKRTFSRCVCLLLPAAGLTLQGCSTATAVGCGVGIAAATALGAVSALAASNNQEGSSPPVGLVMLGSAMFGAVSGCSAAAAAEQVARAERKRPRDHISEPITLSSTPSAPPRPRSAQTRIDLSGLTLHLSGPNAARSIDLGLRRFTRSPDLTGCDKLELQLDGQNVSMPVGAEVGRAAVGSVQGTVAIDLASLEAITRASQVEVAWCGQQSHWSVSANDATQRFLRQLRPLLEVSDPSADAR
jgi:hypothetical protein